MTLSNIEFTILLLSFIEKSIENLVDNKENVFSLRQNC